MSEQPQYNDSLSPVPDQQDTTALLKKIQQQLVSLEKKIDILVNQSLDRPFREKRYPGSHRPFNRHHRFNREHDNTSTERNSYPGRHFEKRHSEEGHGFGYKKKAYGDSGESGFSKEHHFKRHNEDEKRGFDQRKKPFSYRQKDRR